MATRPCQQGPSCSYLPRHHPLAIPHRRKKSPARPRSEAGSSQRHLQPAYFQPHQESRSSRAGSGGIHPGQAPRVILSPSLVSAVTRRCYDKKSAMAASIATPKDAALPAERFFRTSLSLLILTSTVTLVSTGKLDIVTSFAAPLVVLFKGMRWWNGRPAELSHRA